MYWPSVELRSEFKDRVPHSDACSSLHTSNLFRLSEEDNKQSLFCNPSRKTSGLSRVLTPHKRPLSLVRRGQQAISLLRAQGHDEEGEPYKPKDNKRPLSCAQGCDQEGEQYNKQPLLRARGQQETSLALPRTVRDLSCAPADVIKRVNVQDLLRAKGQQATSQAKAKTWRRMMIFSLPWMETATVMSLNKCTMLWVVWWKTIT